MNEIEFILERLKDDNNISKGDISSLIREYNEIQAHIKVNHVKLDSEPILVSQWISYNNRYKSWKKTYEGRLDSMNANMFKPNKPNYFRANND